MYSKISMEYTHLKPKVEASMQINVSPLSSKKMYTLWRRLCLSSNRFYLWVNPPTPHHTQTSHTCDATIGITLRTVKTCVKHRDQCLPYIPYVSLTHYLSFSHKNTHIGPTLIVAKPTVLFKAKSNYFVLPSSVTHEDLYCHGEDS